MSHQNTTLPLSILDFPYVCRFCLSREDLESFEEENMMELFMKISNVVVDEKTILPRKICKGCLNTLIDISVFIDISKHSYATLKKALMNSGDAENRLSDCKKAVVQLFPSTCRSCLSTYGLNPVEGNPYLCSLFRRITDFEMNGDITLLSSVCSKCLKTLEKISAFIDLSRRNNASLHQVFINKTVKHENTENGSTVKEHEKTSSDDTEVETVVPSEKIKLESFAEEKHFTFEEFTLPTEKIKLETSVQEESFSDGVQMKIELNCKNDLLNIETGIFTCDECNKDFPELPSNKDYFGEYPAQCNKCGKKIVEKQETNDNTAQALKLQNSHSSKKRKPPFQCEICSKTVVLYSSLRNHMKKHSGDRPFQCETCQKTFYRKSDLVFHMNTHSKEKPFQCGLCGKGFTHKTYLRIHQGVHATEKPFRCEICSKLVSSGSGLRYHMKTHIEVKPLFTCKVCSKTFSVKGTLNRHMRLHSGENLAECDICLRIFTQKSDLKSHMRMHTDEKPFHCEVCSKSFGLKGNLKVHMRTHSDEKPFKCEVCLKGFCQKSWVRSHMRIHTGERPFPCEVCGKSYAQKSYLRSHMLTHARKISISEDVLKKEVVEIELDSLC